MVRSCCVRKCNSGFVSGSGISFHTIPKNEDVRRKWLNVIPAYCITKNSLVCSLHFKPEDFTDHSFFRRTLKYNAVPSIFPESVEAPSLEPCSSNKPTEIINNPVPGTSYQLKNEELYEPPAKKICFGVRDAAVQTETYVNETEEELKRKVNILSINLNNRDELIHNLRSVLNVIKKNIIILMKLEV